MYIGAFSSSVLEEFFQWWFARDSSAPGLERFRAVRD
jgi:hypothetical protein